MKKSLKKAILTFAAVLAVSATMAMSAFAAIQVTPTYTAETKTLTIAVTGATEGDQITVLALKPGADETAVTEENIAYINQDPAKENGVLTYEITFAEALKDGEYIVKVGGENVTEIATGKFTVGAGSGTGTGDYIIGDVNGDKSISAVDATNVLQKVVGIRKTFTDKEKNEIPELVGDVDNSGAIAAVDATHILQKVVGTRKDFKRTSL